MCLDPLGVSQPADYDAAYPMFANMSDKLENFVNRMLART